MAVSRKNLIKRLRSLGFKGPYSGGKHQFMTRGDLKVRVPILTAPEKSVSLCFERFFARPDSTKRNGITFRLSLSSWFLAFLLCPLLLF